VEIRTLTDDPKQGHRTVLVIVSEKNPGIFRGGIGVDNELSLTLKGYMGAAYRNLFGTGRSINGRVALNDKVKYSFFEKEITLGYTEPFLLNTSNNLKLTGSLSSKLNSIQKDTVVAGRDLVYAVDISQYDVVLERDLSQNLKLLYEVYGIAHTNTYEIQGFAAPTPLDIAILGPTLILNLRDNDFNPTRGLFSSLAAEFSAPQIGSSRTVNYVKTIGSLTKYFPMGPLVFAQELSGGYTKNISGEPDGAIPQVKAFVLGGRSTIRGFDFSEAIPRTTELTALSGGLASYTAFYLVKSELRFPLFGNFAGALFYDGGHVEIPNYTQHFPWRDSAGLGLRYNTPVGPVSLEYGRKLNQDSNRPQGGAEGADAWHFSIGVF
jgi:outer membrane protein assembly factor BamA